MIFKYTNSISLLILPLILLSCKTLDISKKQEEKFIYKHTIENSDSISISNNNIINSDIDDSYKIISFNDIDINKEYKKIFSIKNIIKNENIRQLNGLTYKNQFIIIDKKSNLKIYDLNNFALINNIPLNIEYKKLNNLPSSLARIDNLFYLSYIDGTIISFDIDGKIIWESNFGDILRTPIKIFNSNILALFSNKIYAINKNTGDIKWSFTYENNKIIQAYGGDIVNLNHLLFFILPNNELGQINTIFNEQYNSLLDKIDFEDSINNSSDRLHTHKNIISYFDQKKYITSLNINENKILINSELIDNVKSFKFFNNSIITLTNDKIIKSYNLGNKNLFWEFDASEFIDVKNSILEISNVNNSVIIFFDSGDYINLNSANGTLNYHSSFKLKDIRRIQTYNDLVILYQKNGKITFLSQ